MNLQEAEAYLQMGRSCRLQGRFPEAETALRQALEHDPRNGGVRFELGALYLDQNRFIEAAAEFESAIAIDPNMAGVHDQLGRLYRRQGRLPEAEAALRKALELDPQDGGTRFELGALYQNHNRLSEAAAEFESAIAIDRHHGGAYRHLGSIYRRQGRSSEAEAALIKALELNSQDGGTRFELGFLYAEQNRFIEAAAEFERAIAIDGNIGWAHGHLGRIYRRQGRLSEAEAALHKALEFDCQDGGARFELGALYEGRGKFTEAAAEFRKALDSNPHNSSAHLHLGKIHGRRGRRSEAVAEFEKAIATDPRSVGAHLCLGHIYLRWSRWAEAETEFQQAATLDPRNDCAFVGLWAAYRRLGRLAEAEAALAKAMAITAKSAFACSELLERLERDKAAGGGAEDPLREQVFCLLPWMHLHIRTDGALLPCCMWSGPPLGNVRSSSLAELWNSPRMKALRSDMMNGRPVAGCWRCHEIERSGFLSMRQKRNIDLGRHRGREKLTAPDGTLPRLPLPLLDIRLSNVCNLRCRTCDPAQSSAWAADARALGLPMQGGPMLKPYEEWDTLWRQLQPLMEEGLEEIFFLGGEPLIMEEHYRVLDFFIAHGLTDVRLNYSTNFSTLRFQGRDVIDLWSHFRNVRITASLDGSGRRGEYIRKGLHWDAVAANRKEMRRRCPDVDFSITATISIFNALHLPDFHRECVENGYIDINGLGLNMVLTPEVYRMQVLPSALKQQVLESYRRHRESFLDAEGLTALDFAAAAHFLQAQDRSELLPEFVAMTRRLDQLRGEDCREVFPELAELFEAAG